MKGTYEEPRKHATIHVLSGRRESTCSNPYDASGGRIAALKFGADDVSRFGSALSASLRKHCSYRKATERGVHGAAASANLLCWQEPPEQSPFPTSASLSTTFSVRFSSHAPLRDSPIMSMGLPVGVVGAAPVVPQRDTIELEQRGVNHGASLEGSISGSTLEDDRGASSPSAEHVDVSKAEADFAVRRLRPS